MLKLLQDSNGYYVLFILLIIIFVLLIIFIGFIKSKNKTGEKYVVKKLKKLGYVFHDYVIKDKNNNTHQIDCILVNNKGVFVIEVKNWSGKIYGNENLLKWKQYLANGNVENEHYSPIKQNNSHIYNIKNIIPNKIKVISLIVFIQDNVENIDADNVVGLSDLIKKIKTYKNILSDNDVVKVIDILNTQRDSKTSNKQHVKNIKMTQKKINKGICPRCGGKLVLRKGKSSFYGCSNYPKCTFTIKSKK